MYFVTACTAARALLFGEVVDGRIRVNAPAEAVISCWRDLPNHLAAIAVDAFVVMPNHVHGIVVVVDPADRRGATLGTAVGLFKSSSARAFNRANRTVGRPVWQRGYFDRVVRNDAELRTLREYIATNPLRWEVDRENVESRRT